MTTYRLIIRKSYTHLWRSKELYIKIVWQWKWLGTDRVTFHIPSKTPNGKHSARSIRMYAKTAGKRTLICFGGKIALERLGITGSLNILGTPTLPWRCRFMCFLVFFWWIRTLQGKFSSITLWFLCFFMHSYAKTYSPCVNH